MSKKPVLIFTDWKVPESSLSGKYELTATINGKEWIERATLKLVDPYVALERIMHLAACTAIDWEDYFNRDPKEIVRMKQTALLDILDLFETYQTESFKSKTRRFEYNSHIKVLVPVKEVKPEPEPIKEEPKVADNRNVIIEMINFLADPANVFNLAVQGETILAGSAWDLPTDVKAKYVLGNSFVEGKIGTISFIMLYRINSMAQLHTFPTGDTPDMERPSWYVNASDKIALLEAFKQTSEWAKRNG